MSKALTIQESARLVELEDIIERGVKNFIKVGEALIEIRDKKLYAPYATFEDYCREEWEMGRTFVFYTIEGAKAVKALDVHNCEHLPKTEAQARPLTKLETPEQQREAWSAAVESSNGKPTAKHVEAAVDEIKGRDTAPKTPLPKYIPANGLQYADMAILNLQKIQPNDTQRAAAFARVSKWITKNQ